MHIKNIKNNRGFVILFAVTISSILLAITLGVANIALKEVKFSTSAKDTNDAFLAADTGIEYALFLDKAPSSSCDSPGNCTFYISGLGSTSQGCASVTITKTDPPTTTTVVSKGYNIGNSSCDSTNPNRIERELQVAYNSNSSSSWTFCANENAICSFSGTKQVRYGDGGVYNYLNATGSISCDNATFGDPVNLVVKHCDYLN